MARAGCEGPVLHGRLPAVRDRFVDQWRKWRLCETGSRSNIPDGRENPHSGEFDRPLPRHGRLSPLPAFGLHDSRKVRYESLFIVLSISAALFRFFRKPASYFHILFYYFYYLLFILLFYYCFYYYYCYYFILLLFILLLLL